MFYDSRPLNEDLNMQIQRREAKAFEERERSRMLSESIIEKRHIQREKEIQRSKFLEEAKNTLLTEALFYFVNESLPASSTLEQRKQAESIIYNFVNEEGSTRLLNKYSTKTELLANIANIVTDTYKKVVSETETDSIAGYHIKKSTTDDFYGKLRNLSDDQISKKIMDRVSKQTQEFIAKQVEDNARIEDLATQTKEKIDNVKAKNPETKEAIKQEFANQYKNFSENIRLRRPRSIFEEMVYRMSEKVVKDKTLLEGFYLKQDGKFDVDKVVENATIMYTVLECMNTYKFKEFNCNNIKEIIDNI